MIVKRSESNDATISMTLCFIGRYRNGWGQLLVSHMKSTRKGGAGPAGEQPCSRRKAHRRRTDSTHVAAAAALSQHIVRPQLIRIIVPLQSEDTEQSVRT